MFKSISSLSGWPCTLSRQALAGLRRCRGLLKPAMAVAAVLLVFAGMCDYYVGAQADGMVYAESAASPPKPVAIVLGTAKYYRSGSENLFYRPRIDKTVDLWRAGKIRGILISGDNAKKHYNEPVTIKKDLLAHGIPAQFITLDYAGFRTRDSVLRAKQVFGVESALFVSQDFHVRRALFIARRNGIDAAGAAARDPRLASWKIRVRLREVFARAAAVIDALLQRPPKFLGKKLTVALKPG